MKTWTTSAIALFLSVTVYAATPTFYPSSATFTAAVGTQVVDGYDSPPYGAGFNIYDNATMSAFLGETDYTTTGFANWNFRLADGTYCAGCNGSFRLSFTSTSVTSGGAVFGVGVDVLTNSAVLPYVAFITYGDTSTQDVAIPSGASFFGVSAPEGIVSVHFGLAGGAATQDGSFIIDNLRIAADPSAGGTGTLILEKQTDPNDPNTVFTFDTSAIDPNDPNSPDTTELRDDEQSVFADLAPGTYRIDEAMIPGYELELVDCSVDTGSDDTVWDPNDPNDATGADIVVNAGQVVTCVFNNRRLDATLVVTKTTSPTELSAGEIVTWTVSVTNDGPDPAEAVTLVDDLPDGVALLSATPSQGSCDESGGVVTCDLLTIVPAQTVTVVIEAEVRVVGEIVNEVTVTGNSGFATGGATAPAVLSAATDVPMDDPWMLALLVIALALAGAIVLRR